MARGGGSRGHGQQVNLIMWAQNVVASFSSKSNLWWILYFCVLHPIIFCLLPLVYAFLFYTVFGFVCLVPYILKPYPHATRHGRLTQDQTEKKSWVFFCIGLCWSTTTKGGIFHKRDIPPHIEIKDHFVNHILKLKLKKDTPIFFEKYWEILWFGYK